MKTAIYTVPFSLNLAPEMFEEIKKLSDDAQISMAEQVRNLMEYGFRYIDQNKKGDGNE
ncbi:hypothetical protein [Desulfoferula mesophila]|uniref:Ribbon-helix-helix protein CopG domain-containing protein n=1 Tax=Desulfoferula mesophila TaxID=3058419 RepID=A0AAU9EQP8_9BACT|nr:hypothetical protein FAK_32470 [Desulfoferula mesophilus]